MTVLHIDGLGAFWFIFVFQVWVLTGDKEETAVNISYSAGHFAPHMQEIRLTRKEDPAECMRALTEQRFRVKETRRVSQASSDFALVVDGATLRHMIEPPLRDHLLSLCLQCSTVSFNVSLFIFSFSGFLGL